MNSEIEGEFELISNENFFEYLTALGVPANQAQVVDRLKPTLQITMDETKILITTKLETSTTTSVLKIGQDVEEQLTSLAIVTSYTTVGNDEFTIQSTGPNGEVGKRHFDFFQDGMIMTLSSDEAEVPIAKRFYKRIQESTIKTDKLSEH